MFRSDSKVVFRRIADVNNCCCPGPDLVNTCMEIQLERPSHGYRQLERQKQSYTDRSKRDRNKATDRRKRQSHGYTDNMKRDSNKATDRSKRHSHMVTQTGVRETQTWLHRQ